MRINNYNQIRENIRIIKKANDIILVVKNNAYGFDMNRVVAIALDEGVNKFAVNTIDEAINLRKITNSDILLFGDSIKHINELIRYNIIPSASSLDEIAIFNKYKIYYELEIDIGMNRFGIKEFDYKLFNDEYLIGVYCHFYNENNIDYNIISYIKRECNKYNKKYHFGGSMLYSRINEPLRIGKIIYSNSLELYGSIIMIKYIKKGEKIGYDSLYEALSDQYIGIIDIGYYNGLRNNYNGWVFIKNKRYKIVGKICMNHSFIIIDNNVNIGDRVEFIGDNIKIEEFIQNNSMSEYECFLSIR